MKTSSIRGALALAATALLLGSTITGASADTWRSADASGDVHQFRYDPEPPPCGTSTDAVVPDDSAIDIIGLEVHHRKDTVELAAHFRDLTGGGARFIDFDLETDRRAFEIEVSRYKSGEPATAALMSAAKPPTALDECGGYSTIQIGRPCKGLEMEWSPADEAVSVVVPRRCLGTPRWIRVGVESYRFMAEAVRHDRWAPTGVNEAVFTGPFGPKLRRG